jgi:hypothetical protein
MSLGTNYLSRGQKIRTKQHISDLMNDPGMNRFNTSFIKTLFVLLITWINGLPASGVSINEEVVKSWASSSRFFADIEIEVSCNYFLPLNAPAFTTNPTEMTLVEGAVLPNSFYVKYVKAYREPIVQGASDRDFWYVGIAHTNLIIGSKDKRLGGAETNWTRLAALKQERQLREFTQFGLLFVRPDSLQFKGTAFTAIASITGGLIEGNFSMLDNAGIPHEFRYHFKDRQGVELAFSGKFTELNVQRNEFDCTVMREDDGVLAKTVRVRTVKSLTPASGENAERIFTPTDFVSHIESTLMESNGIQYSLLPNGKWQAIATADKPVARPLSGAAFTVWFLTINIFLIFVFYKIQKKKDQNQQNSPRTMK